MKITDAIKEINKLENGEKSDLLNQKDRYVRDSEFDILSSIYSKAEIETIKKYLKKYNFQILDYNDIINYELYEYDTPRFATIEWENGNIIYENYEKLDEFLDDFLDVHIEWKLLKKDKYSKLNTKPIPAVEISRLSRRNLSVLELKHAIKYYKEKGITVFGSSIKIDLADLDEETNYVSLPRNIYLERLSEKEEKQMFIEYNKEKDPLKKREIRNELIQRNMKLVETIILKNNYPSKLNVPADDLIQIGVFGLIEAIDDYDSAKGSFSHFAKYDILKSITTECPKSILIGIPQNLIYPFIKAKKAIEELYEKEFSGEDDMLDDIVDYLYDNNYIPETKREGMKEQIKRFYASNLEQEIVSNINSENTVIFDIENEQLKDALSILDKESRLLIKLRYGILDDETRKYYKDTSKGLTLKEIAEIFGVTGESIRQKEQKILRILRNKYKKDIKKNFEVISYQEENFTGDVHKKL